MENNFWNIFEETGMPEMYLAYKKCHKLEQNIKSEGKNHHGSNHKRSNNKRNEFFG